MKLLSGLGGLLLIMFAVWIVLNGHAPAAAAMLLGLWNSGSAWLFGILDSLGPRPAL